MIDIYIYDIYYQLVLKMYLNLKENKVTSN